MQPTVFVVDDDEDMRASLIVLLRALKFRARGFASGADFQQAYDQRQPGCLVLDVKMPVQSGLELYETLLKQGKRLPVIFITAHAEVETAVAAMKTGAIEFLEKPFDRHTLVQLVQKAIQLDKQWRMRDDQFSQLDAQITRLTSRERVTLDLIIAGAPNKSMANQLEISERAVEMRRASIMRKLGVRSLAELLDMAITHRVLSDLRTASRHSSFR